MAVIRTGLKQGLNLFVYINPDFSHKEMNQIFRGLDSGIDVDIYARFEFCYKQIEQIRL